MLTFAESHSSAGDPNLRVVSHNIHGLARKSQRLRYVDTADIILLQETLIHENAMPPNIHGSMHMHTPTAAKMHGTNRGRRGALIAVKRSRKPFVTMQKVQKKKSSSMSHGEVALYRAGGLMSAVARDSATTLRIGRLRVVSH
jgi:exonuclease III